MTGDEIVVHYGVRALALAPETTMVVFGICGTKMLRNFRWTSRLDGISCLRCRELLHERGITLPPIPESRPESPMLPDPDDVHALRQVRIYDD